MGFSTTLNILRYPGGKQRHLPYFGDLLPDKNSIKGVYYEPFVGGASVFFALNPKRAVLSDINLEVIELFKGIKRNPQEVNLIRQKNTLEITQGIPIWPSG